jgi:hypothetical protein
MLQNAIVPFIKLIMEQRGLKRETKTPSHPTPPQLPGIVTFKSSQTDGNLSCFKRPPEGDIP